MVATACDPWSLGFLVSVWHSATFWESLLVTLSPHLHQYLPFKQTQLFRPSFSNLVSVPDYDAHLAFSFQVCSASGFPVPDFISAAWFFPLIPISFPTRGRCLITYCMAGMSDTKSLSCVRDHAQENWTLSSAPLWWPADTMCRSSWRYTREVWTPTHRSN